jgi:hypothetical protein
MLRFTTRKGGEYFRVMIHRMIDFLFAFFFFFFLIENLLEELKGAPHPQERAASQCAETYDTGT